MSRLALNPSTSLRGGLKAPMTAFKLTGADEVVKRFNRLGADVQACLFATSQTLAASLEAHVQQDKLSGQVLNRLSGDLAASIATTVEIGDGVVTAQVSVADPPPYASILEFGGVIPAHDVKPVSAEALSFMLDGRRVFAKVAHIPDVTLPAHSYLRSSLQDMAAAIASELQQAVARALKGQAS
jgi:phage gpG-like protein